MDSETMTDDRPFAVGWIVTRKGDDKGTEVFRVKGYGKDGSVTLWGGERGAYASRSIMPEELMRWYGNGPIAVAPPSTRKAGTR